MPASIKVQKKKSNISSPSKGMNGRRKPAFFFKVTALVNHASVHRCCFNYTGEKCRNMKEIMNNEFRVN